MPGINIMQYKKLTNPTASKQNGAALMVSLMLIFILSLLGLTSMRTSALEGRMVNNMLEKELTLQSAESASELALADDNLLAQSICKPDALLADATKLERSGALKTNASVGYGGETVAVGYSLDSGFSMFRFHATGEASLTDSGTATTVTQGLFILGAKSANGGC